MSVTTGRFHPPAHGSRNDTHNHIEFDDVLESQSYDESLINTFPRENVESRDHSSSASVFSHGYRKSERRTKSDDLKTSINDHQLNHHEGPVACKETHCSSEFRIHEDSQGYADENSFADSLSDPGPFDKEHLQSFGLNEPTHYSHSNGASDLRSTGESESYEQTTDNWSSSGIYRGTYSGTLPYGSSAYSNYQHYNPDEEDLTEMFDEDLDDVPPFDELPSVLFLTGDIDERTMKKSLHLYEQKKRLKHIQEMNERKDTINASQKMTRFNQSPYMRIKNKNASVKTNQSKTFDGNESEYHRGKRKNHRKPDKDKIRSRIPGKTMTESSDKYDGINNIEIKENEHNYFRKEEKAEDTGEEIATIREKRLEKLGNLSTKYIDFRNGESNEIVPTFRENDNRATVINEEKMLKWKVQVKAIVEKDKELQEDDLITGNSENKLAERKETDLKLRENTAEKSSERKLSNKEHIVTSVSNTITTGKDNTSLIESIKVIIDETIKESLNAKGRNLVKVEDNKDSSDDENDIPYVMKLLKAKRENLRDETKRTELNIEHESGFDSELDGFYNDFPFICKQKQNEANKKSLTKKNKNKQAETDYPSEEEASFRISFFSFHPISDDTKETTVKQKTPTKNKNKTIKPIPETSITHQVSNAVDTKKDKKVVQKANLNIREDNKQAVLKLHLSDIGERRAQAFRSIKEKHFQSGIHCSSCGRSDCNSMHVQKMKEMVRAAKQTGFEAVDVTPDGNCMFAAVVDQLEFYMNRTYTSKTLREASVNWLIENPNSEDGTPYSSFLEDDWGTYLQRMLGEGQWGDHIMLRAIAQVVRHTVKVFNVGEGEGHWTMVESTHAKADEDDQPIILGQLGEFHYVSLRPSATQHRGIESNPVPESFESNKPGIKETLKNIQLEGNESIAMFEEGYIDEESGMPVLHFSYLLRKIIPRAIVDVAAKSCSNLEDSTRKQETSSLSMFVTGEVGNRVYFDLPFEANSQSSGLVLYSNNTTKVSSIEDSSYRGSFFLYETGVHQGYAKITNKGTLYGKVFFPNTSFPETPKNQEDGEKYYSRGGRLMKALYLWRVPVIQCNVWPKSALSWKTRKRFENWPPKYLVDRIVDSGCILKPTPHRLSQDPENEWEIGFELAEKTLFKEAVTTSQRYCYMAWKILLVQTIDFSGPLTFTHLRSVFLYSCERIPVDFWTSNPGACIIYMFDEVLRCIKERKLPSYFVPTNNMLDYFSESELKDIEEKILTVRNQPITFIQQFHDHTYLTKGGSKIIETIQNDIYAYNEHRSVRRSTLEVFLPASIDLARECLKAGEYESGFNMLTETFEERLSVSTCDDTLPYHLFLQNAVTGLDQNTLVWFSAYTELQLKGQIPKPLILDLYGDQELTKISEVVPLEIAGEFSDTLVPNTFTHNPLEFYNDFAVFLRRIGKAGAVRVLNYAHDTYKIMLTNMAATPEEDRSWEFSMMQIYMGLLFMYREQGQEEKLNEVFPFMDDLAARLNNRMVCAWLMTIYTYFREDERAGKVAELLRSLPRDQNESLAPHYFAKFLQSWPLKITMAY